MKTTIPAALNSLRTLERSKMFGKIICILIAVTSTQAIAQENNKITIEEYLALVERNHIGLKQHLASARYEEIRLRNTNEWYRPDINITSSIESENTENEIDTGSRGIDVNQNIEVSTLTGTTIKGTVGLDYRRDTGDVVGPDDDYNLTQSASIEVSQSLLRGFTPEFNRLPIRQGSAEYESWRQQGIDILLNAHRDAHKKIADIQRASDRIEIERQVLEGFEELEEITESLVMTGQSTALELDRANFQVRQQKQSIGQLGLEMDSLRRNLVRSLDIETDLNIEPLRDLGELFGLLENNLPNTRSNVSSHPRNQSAKQRSQSARLGQRQTERDHWPEISAFWSMDYSDSEQDEMMQRQAFGLRFSYSLGSLATRQNQALSSTDALARHWQQLETHKALETEYEAVLNRITDVYQKEVLLDEAVAIAERALGYELDAFRRGRTTIHEVIQLQQEVQEKRLERNENYHRGVTTLADLLYFDGKGPL